MKPCLLALVVVLSACSKSGNVNEPSPPDLQLSQLSLFPTQLAAVVGEMIPLAVTARDINGGAVTNVSAVYTSTNPTVATVTMNGQIVASGAGTTTVRASAGGLTAEMTVYVGAATYDPGPGPPRLLDANYIDLSKIARISRFRSGIGHSYTNGTGDETCRSMKHYFQPKVSVDWTSVDIYAPVTGTIFMIAPDGNFGFRIVMKPRDMPFLQVVIFHVNVDPGIVTNTWVNAGDHIGRHSSSGTMSDIAVSIGPGQSGTLVSYFETMTDSVFAEYQARGVLSRAAAIITRAQRDADPLPCVGEQGFTTAGNVPNWLTLR